MNYLCEINLVKALYSACGTKYNNFWLDLAFDWQTLVTGVLAGVPAAIGAWLLWRQINEQRNEVSRAREQQEIAARIRMPHALAQLSDYWKHCFRAILAEDLSLKVEPLPLEALETIMAAAPTVNPQTFKIIQRLVVSSQVFESRLRTSKVSLIGNMIPTLLTDVASLDYNTDALYDYARFETDNVDIGEPDRKALADQIYHVLDINERQCAVESKKLRVESALNSRFRPTNPNDIKL